jgi:hypothetical protein
LHEAMLHDEHGQLVTGSFLDYAVPRASWIPPIETIIVEVPAPEGPFGAKGIGEASILPGPAAIANAMGGRMGRCALADGICRAAQSRPAKNARRSATRTSGASIAGK